MSLFGRAIKTVPRAVFEDRAQEVLASYPKLGEQQKELLAGIAGSSPYLSRLLVQERSWLCSVIDLESETAFAQILSSPKDEETALSLRVAKRRVALLTALGDLAGVFSLSEVTSYLTRFADHAVSEALKNALLREVARGRLPGLTEAHIQKNAGGMVVLAMGKMGAHELNYSSDIDLIVLFDETQHDPSDYTELRAGFVRATRSMVALLSEVSEHGYVFRTDLRLRPDPAVTPICIAMEPAERYYESLGRTWERAAFIKARPCAGDLVAGQKFLERLSPFIWRRHLDFAALEDAHDMVHRIREHKGLLGDQAFQGFDIKLGPGGIREIEFFAQTKQLIFGGRDPALRRQATCETLDALVETGHLDAGENALLQNAYVEHRKLEHRLQMLEDAQTHIVPQSSDALAQLVALCDLKSEDELAQQTLARCEKVHQLATGEQDEAMAPETALNFASSNLETIERWSYLPALSAPRAREIFEAIKPELLSRLNSASNPDEALLQFDAFLSGLPAGVQLFSLFKENTQLLDLLVDICATSPRLAQYLGRNSGVFDAVLGQSFFADLSGLDTLEAELSDWLERAIDYEDVLDTARKWRKEQSFRTGVHLLRGLTDPAGAAKSYSAIAEACLRALMPYVEAEVARRYGAAPGNGAAVIAMGKLGSSEMTVSSDLDLIVVYDAKGAQFGEGPKELAVSTYFAKFTQTLISALTAQTAQGHLFEVDMRLRPSGRKGPVAVSLESFSSYQKEEAWTWESLALTRARVVTGQTELAADIRGSIHEALCIERDAAKIKQDVAEMRGRIFEVKSAVDIWDVKSGPGGLLDLEMLLQTGLLLNGILDVHSPFEAVQHLSKANFLDKDEATHLIEALSMRRALQQLFRLISEGEFVPEKAGKGTLELLLSSVNAESLEALSADLRKSADACSDIFERKLAIS